MTVSQSDEQGDATQAGESDPQIEELGGADSQAAGHVRTLDFSQPTKFTTELRRRIVGALDPFCEALAGWLASELGAEVQLRVADVDQHTWASAKARLSADVVAVAVEADSIERHMLLSVELPLLLGALECLLGGEAARAPAVRHLTEVDWVLARGLLDASVGALSTAWGELGVPELTRGEIDMEGDAGVQAPAGEPTLSITLNCEIDGQSSGMSLLIPWVAIEPVAESIRGAGGQPPLADVHDPDALRRGLAGAPVLLRAEVGSTQMGIERMLELAPGTLVELDGSVEDGVLLFAEGVSLGRGRPGRSGSRRAIKLQSTSEPPVRADTYAKIGRSELERARSQMGAPKYENSEGPAMLRSIFVRVWAELGRTHIQLKRALDLAPGSVIELDQSAEAPVELFVNGLCFARGSLVITAEGAWGVQLGELI
jgi:flagellar motor switch protein FliM